MKNTDGRDAGEQRPRGDPGEGFVRRKRKNAAFGKQTSQSSGCGRPPEMTAPSSKDSVVDRADGSSVIAHRGVNKTRPDLGRAHEMASIHANECNYERCNLLLHGCSLNTVLRPVNWRQLVSASLPSLVSQSS
jgi:hypothetical protein